MQKGVGSMETLLVLGLGLGLLRGGSPNPASPLKGPAQPSVEEIARRSLAEQSGKPYCAAKDLLNTIGSFSPDLPDGVEELCKSSDPLSPEFRSLAKTTEINFAIAIVPDPIHTHLSLFFDRSMDAIQQGAQQVHWIFDRASMPWDSQEHTESTDFRIRLQQNDYQGDKEDLPGLMIFRRDSPEKLNSALFIFVVGETPTGGVTKTQFNTAVKLIAAFTEARDLQAKIPLRIIGPTSSGSLYSLAQLASQVPSKHFNSVVIRSGTISSWNTAQWFENWFKTHKSESTPPVDFATFQQSDRYMLRRFIEFENRRGYAPQQIAVLAEDETAYGNREFCKDAGNYASKSSPCVEDTGTAADAAQEAVLQKHEDSVLQLYFPRDISQLRSAYQQGIQSQSSTSSGNYQVHSTLPLNLQDTGSDDDSVQQYAHSQTPLSQESILLGIIAALREHHIQFVVLQATNPMDTIFLSGFLKKGYSQARVVATPADLLLSRDTDDVSLLHGVMALTTYSLLPGIKDEVAIPQSLPETRVSHIFPAAYATGTYNATLSQITCMEASPPPGCEDSSPFVPFARYAEYGWPLLSGPRDVPLEPVVWLTVLGRDGFWPVANLEDGTYTEGKIHSSTRPVATGANSVPAPSPHSREFPVWPLFWRLSCGFVLLLMATFWLLLREGSIMAGSSAMTLLAPVKDSCRSALIAVIGWLLLLASLLLVWPCVAWVVWSPTAELFLLLVAAAVAVVHCRICVIELNRRGPPSDSRLFLRVAVLMIACFVLIYVLPGHSQNSFLYRYVHLTSGVSPLLPLLCLLAAGLWWAWFSLSGLALLDQRHPRLPLDGDLPKSVPPGHTSAAVISRIWPSEEWAQRIVDLARPCSRNRRVYGPVCALAFVGLLALNYSHPLLSLETRHFEWAFSIALGAVVLAVFGCVFRLLVIWMECRRILTVLDHFPLRRAFGGLNLSWEPFWRLGGARWQDLYRLVSRQLETLESLKREIEPRAGDQTIDDLVDSIKATADSQDKMRGVFERTPKIFDSHGQPAMVAVGAGEPASSPETLPSATSHPSKGSEFSNFCIDSYQEIQEKMAKTCAAALAYLQSRWWDDEGLILSEVASLPDAKEGKDKDDDVPDLPLASRLAERFVALVYLNFILCVLLRMRTLTITVAGLYIFLLLSVSSYPFEPRVALRSAAILLLIFIVGMVGYVSAEVHRDSILSLVTQTKPGELGVAFWVRMGSFVALPLISLLVSQFPTLNNALFSWLEPAVSALK
ncbi:MAG: hypothetical protein WAL56_08050 [Candidatus Sulfotelmatobacter sp.]